MIDKLEITPNYGQKENSNIIKVLGVGGGGSNAVTHMYSEGIVGVDFLICNTDQGHLTRCPIPEKLLLGAGLGAGANPEVATEYAKECKEKIKEFIGKETKMLFITAGMGKGTGTGASPVIAEIAHEMGILTIGVVTEPFEFEGDNRLKIANEGIDKMSKYIDSLIVVKNENILELYPDLELDKAYDQANDVLKNAVKCIAELITVDYSQNVDFNDIQTIMKDSGKAMLGLASASGEDRVQKVIDDALECPLLDNTSISDAQSFLFFVSYGPNNKLKVAELKQLTTKFKEMQSKNAHVIWGQGVDETLDDQIKLAVIVTRFNNTPVEQPQRTDTIITNGDNTPFVTEQHIGTELTTDNTPINLEPVAETQPVVIDTTPVINAQPVSQPDIIVTSPMQSPASATMTTSNPVSQQPQQVQQTVQQSPSAQYEFQQSGPVKITSDTGMLDDNFNEMVNTPAIIRNAAMKNAQPQTMTQTAEKSSSFYEVANDIHSFFTAIVD